MKPDKATRGMFNRDAEIALLYRGGVQRRELAERFRLSTAGIHQAIRKAGEEAQHARDSDAFVREFARLGKLDLPWPCERLLIGLGFDLRTRRAMAEDYFASNGKHEVSMLDLMDALIPRHTGQEETGDLFAVMPAYRICNIGKYSYSRMIQQLNRLDLGPAFRAEWDARKKDLRTLLATWKCKVMVEELAEGQPDSKA